MRILIVSTFAIAVAFASFDAARSQDAPQFMRDTWPEQGVDAAWQEFQAIMDPDGALDAKTKELIGLAVSAQVPCEYCVYFHRKAAQHHGATEEEIKEALASAALVRKWSTVLHGSQYDRDEWRRQVDALFGSR
jgi:AhpD family alkylhydroperoxidase